MLFLLFKGDKGLAPWSVTIYMAALSFWSKAQGWLDLGAEFRLKKIVEGFKRESPTVPDKRRPITLAMLQGLRRQFWLICASLFEATLFWAACITMFFGGFQPNEVLAGSANDLSFRALRIGEVDTRVDWII